MIPTPHIKQGSPDKAKGLAAENFLFALLLLIIPALFPACGPSEVDLELPAYEQKLVVEAYLQKDQRLRVILYESVPYFSSPGIPLVEGAVITLSYAGNTDTLQPNLYDYLSRDTIPKISGADYLLSISLPDGRTASATTRFLDPVPIDSVTWSRDPGTGYRRVAVHFQDPPQVKNYYRFTVESYQNGESWDVESDDDLIQGEAVTFFSKAIFDRNDSAMVRLYNIEPAYYEFLVSLRKAKIGEDAPIVEPSSIVTNIEGGTGIFTALNLSQGGIRLAE